MFRNDNVDVKSAKTACLLGALNLLVVPVACYTTKGSLGLLLTLAANAFVIYKFHELGKSRRLGSNIANQTNRFFSARLPEGAVQSTELENTFRNVINGGAAITDEIAVGVQQLANNSAGRKLGR